MSMTERGKYYDTGTAYIALVAPQIIEQCFKPEAKCNAKDFARAAEFRSKLARSKPYALLLEIPDGIPVHPLTANLDLFKKECAQRILLAIAVVVHNDAVKAASQFYFRYYSYSFPVKVLESMAEARQWLETELE